jgi:PAS domain S-box-containing protein
MKQKKALVVDNEKLIVEIISGILENEGYHVEKAYGGLEALEKLKQQKFEIVFLDLVMPRVGGDRICRFIKQSPRHIETKVVIVTAVAIEAEPQISALKADACIAKAPSPKMRENIIKVLKLIEDDQRTSGEIILGKEGVQARTVVKELLFAQRHFEAILNSMSEAVFELDTDRIITYVNPAAQALLGKEEWELIGRSLTEGIGTEKAKEIDSSLDELLKVDYSTTKELILEYSDREYLLSFRNVVRDGVLIGATVVVNDITEIKLLEKERYLRERLAGVIEMAGAAAHELNQPLAVISGHSQLLLRDAKNCDEKLCRRVRIIFDQIERLGELTKKFASIVTYKTKDFGNNIKIVDIEKASQTEDNTGLKGFWE